MASFEQCLKYSLDNCPLFKEKKITLKEKQTETLRALYEDHDCVSVLPTGYGKSVIFQLLPWFCQLKMEKRKPMSVIVVSPLNSLIQDQVIAMRKKGLNACSLNFTGTHGSTYEDADCENDEEQDHEYVEIDVPFEQLERGDFCMIYCHPEALLKTRFSRLLRSQLYQEIICAVVIDEVHMVSEWGEEFRPAFQKFGELMCILEKALHLILTATATPKSIASLAKELNLKNPLVISENVDRPNIFIDIRNRLPNIHKFDKFDDLIEPVATELLEKGVHFPVTIMYVESLEALSYFYQFLSYKLKGASYDGEEIPQNRIYAQYHKDYAESMKKIIIQELTKETPKVRLVLATVALGMGLNAPSVSRIIHCRPPTTLEKYLQEIGRAGRVGQPSVAILFYNKNDIAKNRIGMTEEMRKFCESETCYRIILVNYFGFESVVFSGPKEHCCSICSRK